MDLYIEHYLNLHNYINDKICNIGYDGELFIEKKGFNLIGFVLKGLGIVAIVALFLKLYNFISKELHKKSNNLQNFCDDILNGKSKKSSKDNINKKSNDDNKEPELTEQQILKIKDNIIKIKDSFGDFISQYYLYSDKFNKSLPIFNIEFFCLYNLMKKDESKTGPSSVTDTFDYLKDNKDNLLKTFLSQRKKFDLKSEKVIIFEYIYNETYKNIDKLNSNSSIEDIKECIKKIKLMLRCVNNFINALVWRFENIVGQFSTVSSEKEKDFIEFTLEGCFMDYYRNSNVEKLLNYLIDRSPLRLKELLSINKLYSSYDRNRAENLLNKFVEKTKKANLDQKTENHLFLNFRNYIRLLKEYVNFEVKIINYADQMLKI